MKKKLILLMLIVASFSTFAQGVNFEDKLSWAQVKAKAKAEKKYIFIDFMATWCGPCKAMDEQVYALPEVGAALNTDFISVKVQTDRVASDNEYVKSWYADAQNLVKAYKITGFPTLLFLSPNGESVNKAVGFYPHYDFLKIVKDSKDPSKQYTALLQKYKEHKLSYPQIFALSNMAKEFKDLPAQEMLSRDYSNNFLLKQPDSILYKFDNISYIAEFVKPKDKKAFALFYPDPTVVNLVAKKGDFSYVMSRIISSEIIDSVLYKDAAHTVARNAEPNWALITKLITQQYGQKYVRDNVFYAKAGWYFYSPWKNYDKAAQSFIDYYGVEGKALKDPNDVCWQLFFTHIQDKEMLRVAAGWMKNVVHEKAHPADIDTYANLLYKIGDKENAIKWEKQAVANEAVKAKNAGYKPSQEFSDTLAKMESDVKTWPN